MEDGWKPFTPASKVIMKVDYGCRGITRNEEKKRRKKGIFERDKLLYL